MENTVPNVTKSTNTSAGDGSEGLASLRAARTEIVVHAVRILTKIGIALALILEGSVYTVSLSAYLVLTEILDQASLYWARVSPNVKLWTQIFYSFNSVGVISAVGYFANWILNDYYLVYLIHISSATVAHGFKIGLLSYVLSVAAYSYLLYINHAPLASYIRLPLISVVVLRLLISQKSFEKTQEFLGRVLNIEKAKQDFIAIASHNLRTPVAAIYGYIEILLRGDVGDLNTQQSEFVQKIKANNQELEKLTEQLLQISILEVGKEVNLLKQPSQIEVLIEDVVERYSGLAKSKGLTLTFKRDENILPFVNIDVEKIRSVLSNMVDNAIKYTEKGSVTVYARRENDFVAVSIKDTGVGIAKDELPKIFSKFYRSGNILVYNQTGIGLGLYLGKQIIELHGGTVTVESILGQGSTLTFTLPIVKEAL